MNEYVLYLYTFTALTVVSIWFALGYLTPFLKAVKAIIKCAVESTLTVFFWPIRRGNHVIHTRIRVPIQTYIGNISPEDKTRIYFALGMLIFYADHIVGLALYNIDETILYIPINIYGKTFWVSLYALLGGGWLIVIAELRFVLQRAQWIENIFNKNIKLDILIYR